MKCEIKFYGENPNKKLGIRYGVDKSEQGIILDLPQELINEIQTTTIEEVDRILLEQLEEYFDISIK